MGALVLGLVAQWELARGGFATRVGVVEILMLVSGLAWAAALGWAAKRGTASGVEVAIVLIGAVMLRGVAWSGDAELSDDVQRYVFEGALVLQGQSPYAFAPDSPERAQAREAWRRTYAAMNNTDVSAAYPPLMQLASATAVALAGKLGVGDESDVREWRALRAQRLIYMLADLLVLLPLAALLRRRDMPLTLLLGWAWCPQVLLAFAGTGHFDSLGILLLLASLVAFESKRAVRGELLLAAGAAVKFLPLVALAGGLTSRAGLVRAVRVGALVVAGYVPFVVMAGGTDGLLRGLSEYALRWQSTSALFRFVEPLFEWTGVRDGSLTDPRRVARWVMLLLAGGVALWAARRRATPMESARVLIAAFVLLSPTLHPWYLTWLVPFVALAPRAAWLYLVIAGPLLYVPVAGWQRAREWHEPSWMWWAVFAPVLLLLAIDALRWIQSARANRRL